MSRFRVLEHGTVVTTRMRRDEMRCRTENPLSDFFSCSTYLGIYFYFGKRMGWRREERWVDGWMDGWMDIHLLFSL